MTWRINDKVVIYPKNHRGKSPDDITQFPQGHVVDVKWNMITVRLSTGECEWLECKRIRHYG